MLKKLLLRLFPASINLYHNVQSWVVGKLDNLKKILFKVFMLKVSATIIII